MSTLLSHQSVNPNKMGEIQKSKINSDHTNLRSILVRRNWGKKKKKMVKLYHREAKIFLRNSSLNTSEEVYDASGGKVSGGFRWPLVQLGGKLLGASSSFRFNATGLYGGYYRARGVQ